MEIPKPTEEDKQFSLPQAWRATPDVAAGWVDRSLSHVRSLPPKVKKPKPAKK